MRYVIAAVLGGALALLCAGCPNGNPLGIGPTICDRSYGHNPPILYTDGTTADGVYQTNAWDGEWLAWKGGQHYQLPHGLDCCPANIVGYLSFSERGLGGEEDAAALAPDAAPVSNATIASGDDFGILEVTKDYIFVANDTCSEFFLRVVASGCTPCPDAGSE